ncbi:hypothetical protein BDN72DRAFT_965927 [Pluteus cervinus]|uniref:Uncharacterized protein n=1 Tax=Pluteus cervinus TaxID=181527 RepID=A0ACD3A2D8_9AGAR|nr:hypothetical protein BDN72DRAFT_965927 [Pluteus cervinus]
MSNGKNPSKEKKDRASTSKKPTQRNRGASTSKATRRGGRSASPQVRKPSTIPLFTNDPSAGEDSELEVERVDDAEMEDESDIEDLDEEARSPRAYCISKGRIIGRYRFMFVHFGPVLEAGLHRVPGTNIEDLPKASRALLQAYDELVGLCPGLSDMVKEAGPAGLSKLADGLKFGRAKARGSDISTMKENIHRWKKFKPSFDAKDRPSLGFYNHTTGGMLCPPTRDWKDEQVRQDLANGTIRTGPNDLPRFLWENEHIDLERPLKGFMRGAMVVKGMLHIYKSPSSAIDNGTERPSSSSHKAGNASLHSLTRTTMYALAYAATLVRFVLSNQGSFASGEDRNTSNFPYEKFYRVLVQLMKKMGKPNDAAKTDTLAAKGKEKAKDVAKETTPLTELLDWYDERMFGDGYMSDEESDGEDLSIAGIMMAQLKSGAIDGF